MVRGLDDDPALRVISRVSSVKRAFADAGRALRQLADEQGHGVVDGLYATADEVLGSLKESQPFRDVMAHELMTSPPNLRDQQVQELRGKLVRYLAGDLGGGADSSTADDLLSATVARVPGNTRSERMQRFQRRVAVGMSFSGLLEVAVDRVLRTEAVENALREDFSITAMGARFNRSREWGRKVLNDVKQQLSSDLEAAVGSLRQLLAEAEASADLWDVYEAQIAQWLDLDGVRVDAIRSRVEEAVAVVQGLREWFRDNAIPEMRDSFETAGGELRQLEALHGPDPVGYTFAGVEQRFRGMQDDQLRNAVPHRLLTHGGHIGDAQALLRDWDQLYERAAAQVHEWAGIAGREAVAGLLADADGILGPLAVSGRFRMVLAQWLGEHPGDWRGAQAVRGELADYLAGDPDIGVAASGLARDAFEEVRAEEERWQADRAGNQAAAVAAPMVRGVDDDPALRVISRVSSVKRAFADAGRALRQLADEQGHGVVDGLYAAADEVLGSLKESQPFRDVMAHELMTNPRDDQQLQELRWGLVRYLAGDPSGGADSNTANDLLAATRTVSSVENEDKVREQLIYRRRVAVGKVLSGLPEDAAVDRVLRNEAREYVLREDCDRSHLMNRFNRGNWWIVGVVTDVKQQLSSDLEAAVGSLRQILAEAEASADLRNAYEAQIAKWLRIDRHMRVKGIRGRVAEAVAAVQGLRERFRSNAIPEMRESFETADGGLWQLGALHGPDPVGRAFADVDQHFGRMLDDSSWNAVAHGLLTHGGHLGDAQVFLRDWHERYERAVAQVHEWAGIVGRDAVDRLLADAEGVLGPLKVLWRFRMVLAQWLGEHPGDGRGAWAVRGELAGYLAGDPDFGVAVSGLTRDTLEAVRAEEARWQEGSAGNQADAGAVAVSMVRGVGDDPALDVISRVSSVKRAFADAGRALRQLADEQGHGVVDGLYATADEVLGSLKESQPFRDVMAHELMTSPPNLRDQQVQELRWKLVRYLAGDLSGGADSSTADILLSATMAPDPGKLKSEAMMMFHRRVAVGISFSGLPDSAAVDRVLRNEAGEYALRVACTISDLGERSNRSRDWGRKVLNDVGGRLSSDLEAAVGSLRQILTEAEASTDLWNAYEAQIAQWLDLDGVPVDAIRSRAEEAVAAVQGLRTQLRNNDGRQLEALHGPDPVGRAFADVDQHFGRMLDGSSWNAVAHGLLTHGGQIGDVQAFLRDWDERYERAAAQLDEWAGIAGFDAVDRLLADADGLLGPLRVSERFRMVLAQWLGEHPGDWRGAWAVRGELAGYLAGDPEIGVAVSGLTRDVFEAVRAEEARWQEVGAGNQAAVASPMVRGGVVDPALDVFSRVSSVKRAFADAGRALRQLADEQGHGVVDGLYAAADEVLGSLKESQPFRDVMAYELMTAPRDDQPLPELRWKLVRYLAGDLGGGADSSTADDLLSATVAPEPENKTSEAQQVLWRRVAVGKVLSGLRDDAAVERLLRDEAVEDALHWDCTAAESGARFNRSAEWGRKVLSDVRDRMISDLDAAVGALRQVLAEAEVSADLWNEYEAKITNWLNLYPQLPIRRIRDRAEDAAAAVRWLRRNNAIRELQEIFETAGSGLQQLEDRHGRDQVGRAFADVELHFGGMQDDQLRNAVAHRLLMNDGQIGDAQEFLQRLHRLRIEASAVIAGAGSDQARDMLAESAEGGAGEAVAGDTESVFDEAERAELLERLDRLRGDAESPEGAMPAAGASDLGESSRRDIDQYARSGDVAVGGASGSLPDSGGSGAGSSGDGPRDGAGGPAPGAETPAAGESDSGGMDPAGFGALAEPNDHPEDAGESRADGATGSMDVDRAEEARQVVEYYAGIAGGETELANAIGLHHQERGFGRFSARWVRDYEQRLVNIARLMLDVFGSAPREGAGSFLDLRNTRRLFDAVRRRNPGVGERVTIDHVRQMVRDFNPADERPVSDADVQTLMTLIESARDRWHEASFQTLRRAWHAQTAPVAVPGSVALRVLESIADRLTADRAGLEANNREGLLARVDVFLANVREEERTPWRPTDRSRVISLNDLQVTGEWLLQEVSADVSVPAEAALVALTEEHGGGRAVARAVGVDARYGAQDRQSLRETVNQVWERLAIVVWLAVNRDGDRPTLDQLRQAAELDRLWPRVQMLRVLGADSRLDPMPADLDEAGRAEYLRSVLQLWAERARLRNRFGGAAARAVTEDDVRHLADLMMSQARERSVTWETLARAWNTELRAVGERGEGAMSALRSAAERMTEDLAPLPSWYRQDLRELADQMAWVAGAQVVAWRAYADALVVDRLEQLNSRALVLVEEVRAAREAADAAPLGPLMLADELVRRFGRGALGADGHGELRAAERRRIVRFGALASVLADVRRVADLDVADVRRARQVARALTEAIPGLRATGVAVEDLRGIVRDFLGLPAGTPVSHEDVRNLAFQLVAVPSEPAMLREVGSRWVSDRINSALSGLWSVHGRIAARLADLPLDYRPDLRAAMAEAALFRAPANVRWALEDGRQVRHLEELRSGLESLAVDVPLGEPDAHGPLSALVRAVELPELRSEAPRAAVDRADDSGSGGSSARDTAPGLHGLVGAFQSVLWQEPRAIRAGLFVRSGLSDDGLLLGAARRISSRRDRFVVVVRGDGLGGVLVDGRSADARTLADLIRRSPNWNPDAGASVWLFACAVSPAFVKELKKLLNSRVLHGVDGLTWIGPGTGDFVAMVTTVVAADGVLRPLEPPTGRLLEHLPGVDAPVEHGPYAIPLDGETPRGLGLPHPVHLRAPVDERVAVQDEQVFVDLVPGFREDADRLRAAPQRFPGAEELVSGLARRFAREGGDGWEGLAREVGLDVGADDFRAALRSLAELAWDVDSDDGGSVAVVLPRMQRLRVLIEIGFEDGRQGAAFYDRSLHDLWGLVADLADPVFNPVTGQHGAPAPADLPDAEVHRWIERMDVVDNVGGYHALVNRIGADLVNRRRLFPVIRLAKRLYGATPGMKTFDDLAWLAGQLDPVSSNISWLSLTNMVADLDGRADEYASRLEVRELVGLAGRAREVLGRLGSVQSDADADGVERVSPVQALEEMWKADVPWRRMRARLAAAAETARGRENEQLAEWARGLLVELEDAQSVVVREPAESQGRLNAVNAVVLPSFVTMIAEPFGGGWREVAAEIGLGEGTELPADYRQSLENLAELYWEVDPDLLGLDEALLWMRRVRVLIDAAFGDTGEGAAFYKRTIDDLRILVAVAYGPVFNPRTGQQELWSPGDVEVGDIRHWLGLMDVVHDLGGYHEFVGAIGADLVGGRRLFPVISLAQELYLKTVDMDTFHNLAWLANQFDAESSTISLLSSLTRMVAGFRADPPRRSAFGSA